MALGGKREGAGRPKGAINRRSIHVAQLAADLGVDPIEVLLLVCKGDWKSLGYKSGIKTKSAGAGEVYEEDLITLVDRVNAAKEASQYLYSKLKTIEVLKENPHEGMSLEEKRDVLRKALLTVERQIEDKVG